MEKGNATKKKRDRSFAASSLPDHSSHVKDTSHTSEQGPIPSENVFDLKHFQTPKTQIVRLKG